jgi:thymidylate kinase
MAMNPADMPFIVSFSGIDGAGKTTQIESLRQNLEANGTKINLIRFWDDVATLKWLREASSHTLFKSEVGVGTPKHPVNRRDKNIQSWYMTPVRFFLYFLDSLRLNLIVRKTRRTSAHVVIFDRYIYDELANLNLAGSSWQKLFATCALRWTSKPDVAFLVDADPVQARARKPEYPLEFLLRNREAYLELSRMAPVIRVIKAHTVAEASSEIFGISLQALGLSRPRVRPVTMTDAA